MSTEGKEFATDLRNVIHAKIEEAAKALDSDFELETVVCNPEEVEIFSRQADELTEAGYNVLQEIDAGGDCSLKVSW